MRPEKYFRHLEVLTAGGSFRYYFEYPPTLAGYGGLAWETFGHLVDALGWPVLVGAGAGILVCCRRERLSLALLLTIPGLFLTVLAPVRFVLLRFVMILGFVLACFAARGVAAGLRSGRWSARLAAGLILVTGCGLGLLRGADLTYIMLNDSQYQVSDWLARHTRDGDRVEIFGWEHRFRRLPLRKPGLIWMSSALTPMPGDQKLQGEFVLLSGRDDLENHSLCPRWVYEGLLNRSMGYELVADIQTPSLFDLHYEHLWVNTRFLIFARRDRVRRSPGR